MQTQLIYGGMLKFDKRTWNERSKKWMKDLGEGELTWDVKKHEHFPIGRDL